MNILTELCVYLCESRSRARPSPTCSSDPPWLTEDVIDDGPAEPTFRFRPTQRPLGPQLDRTKRYSPVELFQLFFPESALRTLCENTNKCAARNKTRGKKYKWVVVDVPELKKFIGLLIFMALVEIADVRDFWRKKHICSVPYPSQVLSLIHI